ncbi:MAG: aminotransferase class V-fold PLP-dependent enzyme [Chloroflexota bacterium]
MTLFDRSESEPPGDLSIVGSDRSVPLVNGETRRYVNLDFAASTPPLTAVAAAVDAMLPWYSSVHRGAGFKSQLSTAAFEGARDAIREFFNVGDDDAVVFTRNTTEAINLLASCLPDRTEVLAFEIEHHANLLPWRGRARYLPAPDTFDGILSSLEVALERTVGQPLVAVTGASNVTGEIWPVAEITALAHRYNARVLLDAAQLAPHHPIDMRDLGVDYLAMSGHKMYAPYGAGVLIGRPDWLSGSQPFLVGGGAVDFVTTSDVTWSALPDRQEAGSPNVAGAVALGASCRELQRFGMARLAGEEAELAGYARRRLDAIEGLVLYQLFAGSAVPRLAITTFNLDGVHHSLLAAILSAEYGIGVRNGCFCAHPYLQRLLACDASGRERIRDEIASGHREHVPGAVRASLGIGSTRDDIDALADALKDIGAHGPRWQYRVWESTGEYLPDPDPRCWPDLPFRLATPRRTSES